MKKAARMIGRGFVYGMMHPFTNKPMKGSKDDSVFDLVLSDVGASVSQTMIAGLMTAGFIIGLGYVSSRIENKPIHANSKVDRREI